MVSKRPAVVADRKTSTAYKYPIITLKTLLFLIERSNCPPNISTMLRRLAYAAVTALSLADAILAVPEEALAPVQVLETRRHTRTLDERALQNMRRDFVTASLKQRDSDPEVYKTNGSLDLSWNDAELFSYGVLAVTCAECYVKGTVHATLTFETDFNISKAFTHFIGEFGSEIINITEQVWDEFVDWAGEVYENTTDTILEDVKDAVTFQCTRNLPFDPRSPAGRSVPRD